MSKLIHTKKIYLIIAIILVIALLLLYKKQAKQVKVSAFGQYQGYSERIYDGTRRTSDFLTLADGTRLAYDLILPTKNGVPADKPLPVLFKYTPYGRAWTIYDKNGKNNLAELVTLPWYYKPMVRIRSWFKGNVMDALSRAEWLKEMVHSGYAVIVVDRPGTGASFGKMSMDPEAGAKETDEILNWIATRRWCDGHIGMFGDSIQAQIQFQAAGTGNPHLKAILPATTWMDNYSAVVFPGGVLNKAMTHFYVRVNKAFDSLATPVDQDKDGILLAQARAERHRLAALAESVKGVSQAPYRDFLTPKGKNPWIDYNALYPLLDRINRSGVPVYLINGWYDIYARDNFMIYANLTGPKRLLVRPTDHDGIEAPGSDIDYAAEAHRWFDYWLKGIDNGIMKEPPIHYYLQGVGKKEAYKITDVWPLKNQKITRYYFGAGTTGGTASLNNGTLVPSSPTTSNGSDTYTVDYTTTTGTKPHWTALASAHEYPNMRSNDAKALTYTTPLLEAAAQVIGHPVAHVWLTGKAPDLDLFAYLEEVDGKGNSTYITQGNLRASHRVLSRAPFDNLGLPWHNHFQSEVKLIPTGEPVELVFDLLPTAYQFAKGKSIRITIAFADANNFDTPVIDPAPKVQLLRDKNHPSFVELPVVQGLR